ncbi:hypothetical protein GOBAR_DD33948 [Gossypium barbadense]|nr:hypothetical protein GOBAR_DD33948 [Gossypium barbadense]
MNMSTAVTACISSTNISHHQITEPVRSVPLSPPSDVPSLSRYESQKRRDWTTFGRRWFSPAAVELTSLEFLKLYVLWPPSPTGTMPLPLDTLVDHLRAVLCIKFDLQVAINLKTTL